MKDPKTSIRGESYVFEADPKGVVPPSGSAYGNWNAGLSTEMALIGVKRLPSKKRNKKQLLEKRKNIGSGKAEPLVPAVVHVAELSTLGTVISPRVSISAVFGDPPAGRVSWRTISAVIWDLGPPANN